MCRVRRAYSRGATGTNSVACFALTAMAPTGAGIDMPGVDGAAANTSGEASGAAATELDAVSPAATGLAPTGALLP